MTEIVKADDNNQLIHRSPLPSLPASIERLGENAKESFVDFFTAQIRNANTRESYFRNICRFLEWMEARDVELPKMKAFHVAAYVEELCRPAEQGGLGYSPATVKQHVAALRGFGAFLVTRQVIPHNPVKDVRGPKHIVREGKTPVLSGPEARALFESIDVSQPAALRDRALLGVMVYTFGRISAVLAMDVTDYFQVGRRMMIRLKEKGGRQHAMPVHHTAIEYLDAYLERLGKSDGPLFCSVNRKRTDYTGRRLDRREALDMVKRRCRKAGLGDAFSNHTFRGTGITAYLSNDGALEHAQYMAAHASPKTTKLYDRRKQDATLDEIERIIL
jgi:site-specific recombinase XerD